jgi:hypothetical protein
MCPKNVPACSRPRASALSATTISSWNLPEAAQDIGAAIDDGHHVSARSFREAVTAKRYDLEAAGARQRGQAPDQPAVVDGVGHHGIDAGLQRVMVAQRDRGGRIVAIEDPEPSARAQDLQGLGKGAFRLGHVR